MTRKNLILLPLFGSIIILLPFWVQASAVDHSAALPPVRSQGSYGSCVGWATAYYYKTYQEEMEHGWNVDTTDHQYSPSFVWNQVNGGTNSGTYFSSAFDVMDNSGCATWSSMPYTSYTAWPNQSQWENAMWYRANNYTYMSPSNIDALKAHLDSGDIFVMGVPVYSDYLSATGGNDVHDGPRGGSLVGGHAITIVGYDDSRQYTDAGGNTQHGAFKWVNSWGSNWSGDGFSWLSYRFVANEAWEAWKMEDRVGYQPLAWAKVSITHPKKNQLEYKIGAGTPSDHPFEKFLFNNQGAANDNINAVHDLTDGIDYLPPASDQKWYLWSRDTSSDGSVGTLDDFSIVYQGQTYQATGLPNNIPEGGNSSTVYVEEEKGPNNPPTQPNVTIDPVLPKTNSDLTANASGSTDPDGDQVNYKYTWYKDDLLQASLLSNSVDRSATSKNEVWRVVVTPTDGQLDGPSAEAEVTIVNSDPILSPVGNKTVTVNSNCSFAVSGSDADQNDILILSAANLPQGATFDASSGQFNWKPTSSQLGTYPGVHFEITDGEATDTEEITITVTKESVNPKILFCQKLNKFFKKNRLFRGRGNRTVYLYSSCKKRPIISARVFKQRRYRWSRVKPISRTLARKISRGQPLVYKNRTLLKAKGKATVWIIQKQKRRYIKNPRILRKIRQRLPRNRRMILKISWREMKKIPYGGKAWLTIKVAINEYHDAIVQLKEKATELVSNTLYRLESGDGKEFSKPVEVALEYDPSKLPQGQDQVVIRAMSYDGAGNWKNLPTTIDKKRHIARAETSSLNLLGLFAQAKSANESATSPISQNPNLSREAFVIIAIATIIIGASLAFVILAKINKSKS